MQRHRLRIVVPAYPAFNIYSRIARKTTALGPVCVASSVNEMKGWDAEVIDENNLRRYGPQGAMGGADHAYLQDLRPARVVGLYGGLTSTIPRLYEIARFYRQRGVVTVAGGQHFVGENIAEALSSGIDYVVIGEGEETIRELLDALRYGRDVTKLKGIAFLRNGRVVETPTREPLTDFDSLPAPDFSLVRHAKIRLYPVGRIRGCGMNCEFCTVKGKPRCAPVERLVEDISCLVETQGARHFFVVDDLFGQQRTETLRFCRRLSDYQQRIGRQLVLTVQIRLDKATDTELLAAMREAGIQHVAIGFESPIEEELAAMDKRVRAEEMLSLTRTFRRFGFWVHGMFIFGYPSAGDVEFAMPVTQRVRRFRRFIRKARIDSVQVLLPVPLPGTKLRERLVRQNRVYSVQDVGWQFYDGNFPLFEPDPPLTAAEMQAAVKQIMGRFYNFHYMFMVVASILSFPALALSLHRLRVGWEVWYRRWQNYLIRFGGWITIRRWSSDFRKSGFAQRLHTARKHLHMS
jgi:radical SAM superfamily enzyme YgiQ (UPF0313 family)